MFELRSDFIGAVVEYCRGGKGRFLPRSYPLVKGFGLSSQE